MWDLTSHEVNESVLKGIWEPLKGFRWGFILKIAHWLVLGVGVGVAATKDLGRRGSLRWGREGHGTGGGGGGWLLLSWLELGGDRAFLKEGRQEGELEGRQ